MYVVHRHHQLKECENLSFLWITFFMINLQSALYQQLYCQHFVYMCQNYFDLLSALDRKIQCQHQRLGGGWTNAWIQVHLISVQNAGNINTITKINSTYEFLTDTRLLFVKSVMFCTVGARCCLIACRRHDRTLFLADPLQSVVKPKNLCNDNNNE